MVWAQSKVPHTTIGRGEKEFSFARYSPGLLQEFSRRNFSLLHTERSILISYKELCKLFILVQHGHVSFFFNKEARRTKTHIGFPSTPRQEKHFNQILQSLKDNTHYRKKLKVFKIFRRSLINRGLKINNHFIAIFLPLHLKSIVLVFTICKLCLLVCLFNRTSDLLSKFFFFLVIDPS